MGIGVELGGPSKCGVGEVGECRVRIVSGDVEKRCGHQIITWLPCCNKVT